MNEILQSAKPIAMFGMIGMFVGGALTYWIALRIGASRDELRKLRSALERDPSPMQLNDARKRWPQVAQIAEKLQTSEMRRLASADEMMLSQSFERGKAMSRVLIGFGVFCLVIYVVATFYRPAA